MEHGEQGATAADKQAATFRRVVDCETKAILEGCPGSHHPMIGLALSGGGIRSATFSLGVLQALARAHKLASFDYLSTVSGGGYIGSWLSAWIHRSSLDHVQKELAKVGGRVCERSLETDEPEEVSWLRRYSNFLAPKLGLLSADSLTLVATWLRNVALNLVVVVSLLGALLLLPRVLLEPVQRAAAVADAFGLAALWAGFLVLLTICFNLFQQGNPPTAALPWFPTSRGVVWTVILPTVVACCFASVWMYTAGQPTPEGERRAPASVIGVLLAVLLVVWFVRAWRRSRTPRRLSTRRAGWSLLGNAAVCLVGASVPIALAVALIVQIRREWMPAADVRSVAELLTFGPPGFLIGFSVCGWIFVGLAGRAFFERTREWWSRMNGLLVVAGCAWFALFALAFYVPAWLEWAWASFPGWSAIIGSGWLVSLLGTLLGYKPAAIPKTAGVYVDRFLNVAAGIFVAGFLLAVAAATHWALVTGAGLDPIDVESSVSGYRSQPSAATNGSDAGGGTELAGAPLGAYVEAHMCDLERLTAVSPKASCEELGYGDPAPGDPAVFGLDYLWGVLLGVVVVFALFGWRVDINKFSLHNMYKNRLVRCYLGASNRARRQQPFTGLDDEDDVPLRDLADPTKGRTVQRPYHLINAALNLSQGRNLAWQERKAASFVFAPKYCGFTLARTRGDTTEEAERPRGDTSEEAQRKRGDTAVEATREGSSDGYCPTAEYGVKDREHQGFTLGMALATSGAAASPNMGRATQPFRAFVLTLFNARLGRWSANPARSSWERPSPWFGAFRLIEELFGHSNERSRFLYLSDGGHFENLAIYELVRRRCAVIFCIDATADPQRRFSDLAEAVRKCRIDFGVEIEVNLDALRRLDDRGRAEQSFICGKVHYPPGDEPASGWLVFIKPTLTAREEEPADVLGYARRDPTFPHQTTADQFFEESQFESYRRLGLHIGERCLEEYGVLLPPYVLLPDVPARAPDGDVAASSASQLQYWRSKWFIALAAATVVSLVALAVCAERYLGGNGGLACALAAAATPATPEACVQATRGLLASPPGALTWWLWFDNAFVVVYTAMFALGALLLAERMFGKQAARRRVFWRVLVVLAVLGGLADYLENFALLAHAGGTPIGADPAGWLATVTAWKFRLTAVNLIAVIVTMVLLRPWRPKSPAQ